VARKEIEMMEDRIINRIFGRKGKRSDRKLESRSIWPVSGPSPLCIQSQVIEIGKSNTTRVYLLFVYYKEQLLSDSMFRPLFLRPSSVRKYLYQGN
jgi:hypothetical protein